MRIGIITGSGTYALPGLDAGAPREVATSFGPALVSEGTFAGTDVLHVSRHGAGHRRLSSAVTHQANIAALRDLGAGAILAATVCGALDPQLELGSLLVFDDLHFPSNRLPDGALCTLHTEPGAPGRGHWIFDGPFAEPLRAALLAGARDHAHPVRDGGTYGHVDGPRFNTRSEIAALRGAGVTAVSQTAGPETVLAGEAGVPFALLGYATDFANGVRPDEPTPVAELVRLVELSTEAFARTLAATLPRLADARLEPVGTHFAWADRA
jgi:5'-methylthioadenosine phosphorylase